MTLKCWGMWGVRVGVVKLRVWDLLGEKGYLYTIHLHDYRLIDREGHD